MTFYFIEKKGKSKIDVQDQIYESDPSLTKWHKGKTGGELEAVPEPSKKINYKERDHHRLYSHHGSAIDAASRPSEVHRQSYSTHQANRTSFNIFGF